jgi:hypothetical protein
MGQPNESDTDKPDTVPFEEVVRRLLAAPAHHIPAKPANGKLQPKKKPAPKRKPR